MTDKLTEFKQAGESLPERNRLWPLYGAGFENLGRNGQPIEVPMPEIGPDQLLVRHDACGLCFSDIKIIKLGEEHPRIYRQMADNPVVMGHEIAMTVVEVGENLRGQYQVGDRFTIQADVFVEGVGYAYGYEIQGGLSLYNVIDQRVLAGDDGNYLLPVRPDTGYAESALTEPWACVTAAYGLTYRTGLKPGGTTWIIGTAQVGDRDYAIGAGFDAEGHPARLLLSQVSERFAGWLKDRAAELGVEVVEVPDPARPPVELVDDIVVLGADPNLVEQVSPFLDHFGILALIATEPMPRKVSVDIGRVHYNRWAYVGGRDPDIARAYSAVPVRSALQPGGRAWFVGAGGPMGRMHVQRAIQMSEGPRLMVCSDVSDLRLGDLEDSYATEARDKGIEFLCLNPMEKETYGAALSGLRDPGFDDIMVLAPVPAVIAEASGYLAPQGVMNVFAGVARGTTVDLDLSEVYLRDVRFIGHSASTIDDLRLMLQQTESGELSPNRSVAAIGSLSAARDGLEAVRDTSFPGKVVIYPQIKEFPLTSLAELKDRLPTVYAKLAQGREWTNAAEEEFLRLMLP